MLVIGEEKRVGLGRRAPSRFLTLACLVASVVLLVFSQYAAEASVFKKARQSVVDASAPVLEFFSAPIEAVNGAIGQVGDYFAVIAENRQLRDENAALRAWRDEALRLREDIARYERVLNMTAPPEATFIDARVVGEGGGPYDHAFLVNAGRKDGVEEGSAVIDDLGLVGYVITAGENASRVLLLTDFASSVPVFIEGADEQAILGGRGGRRPELTFLAASSAEEIVDGQRVVTSGKGGVLPRGLPVGLIDGADRDRPRVALFSDFDRTTTVRVIRYQFPDEAESTAPTVVRPPSG
ncbi:MAG: rod shape-determining protein MreC [Pseudomonadota bacterium]